ncbi:MAG: hypothetical protein E7413_00635 [Ruminococcaceae bacterium]|nr:hypothetical protein [Oscillospiraceae bacterium]
MKLDEYRKEVSGIYNIYQTIFEKSQDEEVYEATLNFRDDEDFDYQEVNIADRVVKTSFYNDNSDLQDFEIKQTIEKLTYGTSYYGCCYLR